MFLNQILNITINNNFFRQFFKSIINKTEEQLNSQLVVLHYYLSVRKYLLKKFIFKK